MKCLVCGFEATNNRSLSGHVKRHGMSILEYKAKFDLTKKCSSCQRVITRGSKTGLCVYCSRKGEGNPFFGRTHTETSVDKIQAAHGDYSYRREDWYRKMISEQTAGRGNPMYGRKVYDVWLEKYGKEEADRRRSEKAKKTSIQCSGSGNPMFGRPSPRKSGNGWCGWYGDWFFRSLIELSFVLYLEKNEIRWQSAECERFRIPYMLNGVCRNYFPDFFLLDERAIVECKPKRLHDSVLVKAKTKSAKEWCRKRGYEFRIVDCEKVEMVELIELIDEGCIILTERTKDKLANFRRKQWN